MLSFDIRSLDLRAAMVDGLLPADNPVWLEGDPVPSAGVRVSGRLSATGTGQFYWHGRIAGSVVLGCSRCLADVTVEVTDEAHLIFAPEDDTETDDPDVYRFGARDKDLDLGPAIRELWLLNVPKFALCREDCKGLCPTCGSDLNSGACGCPPAHDARWDALHKLHSTSNQ